MKENCEKLPPDALDILWKVSAYFTLEEHGGFTLKAKERLKKSIDFILRKYDPETFENENQGN